MDKKADFMANLMKGKQIMDGANNYKVDHVALHQRMQGSGNDQLLESVPDGATPQTNATRPMGTPSVNQIENSNLPEEVKRLMIEQPMPKLEMGSGGGPTFSINDVKNLVQPQAAPQAAPQAVYSTQASPQRMNEATIVNSQGQMLITMTESELDKKINDKLLDFMATTFTKNLTETAIKRTISTLIKEGKIKVKQKTAK
jgi:hypothetical protein